MIPICGIPPTDGSRYRGNVDDAYENLAANLDRLMAAYAKDGLGNPVAIEETTNGRITKSTIYRMVNREGGYRLDGLLVLAEAFKLPAWALLAPGMDPAKPPVLMTQEALEEAVDRRAEALVRAMLELLGAGSDGAKQEKPRPTGSDLGDSAGATPRPARGKKAGARRLSKPAR